MEMYLFCFVSFLALARVPEAVGSNCSSYYILLQKHDPVWDDLNRLKPVTEARISMYKEKIDWNKYNIRSDVPELMKLDHHCVINLDCKNEIATCIAKIKPTVMTGADERIVNPKPILDTSMQRNATTDDNDDDITNSTIIAKTSSYQENETSSTVTDTSTPTETTTDDTTDDNDDDITNSTIIAKSSSYQENETSSTVTDTSTPTETTTDDTTDDYDDDHARTIIIAENSSDQKTTINDEINNKYMTTTEPIDTTVNTEIINVTLNKSQNTTLVLIGRLRKNYSKSGEQTSYGVQAGKIAAGIMGAGALVAMVLIMKKFVLGCFESGVYHIPA